MRTIHNLADVRSENIGDGTRIWQFCVILPEARIGKDCNICSHVFIENDVLVGDRVTVKCGVQLWDGVTLEDDVFIGPNVTFCNDKFPRSRIGMDRLERTIVQSGASIGANATILPGVVIGRGVMVGAGSVVARSIPAGEVWIGNPAHYLKMASVAEDGT
jgi:UDP-2-acetamido-3-amino-2,3-dideoxy-glucuronate N-acetyltransferase